VVFFWPLAVQVSPTVLSVCEKCIETELIMPSTLGWPKQTQDLENLFPTSVLETGELPMRRLLSATNEVFS
jgi:hypothetical protein